MYLCGLRKRSWSMMSCRTCRVALAVNAAIGRSGNCARSELSCRYSGRNSCPHSEMQWASSMARSEEHTSELQSPDHLVCRLLLEKKKKNTSNNKYKNRDTNRR